MSIAEWMTSDLWGGVREFEQQYPTLSEREVAEKFVRAMSATQRREALVQAILDIVEGHRASRERARVRAIEESVTRIPVDPAEFERQRLARLAEYEANPRMAPRNTRAYRKWSETEEGKEFEAERLARVAEEEEKDRLYDEDPEEYSNRYGWGYVRRQFDEWENRIRLKVTAELLSASFALGDGRTVTWGDATIEDHHTRIGLLQRQLIGTGDAIARHEAAVSMIVEAGVARLGEVKVAA